MFTKELSELSFRKEEGAQRVIFIFGAKERPSLLIRTGYVPKAVLTWGGEDRTLTFCLIPVASHNWTKEIGFLFFIFCALRYFGP